MKLNVNSPSVYEKNLREVFGIKDLKVIYGLGIIDIGYSLKNNKFYKIDSFTSIKEINREEVKPEILERLGL